MHARFALSLAIALVSAPAAATTIVYNDFADLSGLQLNGNTAAINTGGSGVTGPNPGDGAVLRVTSAGTGQSGSAFLTTPLTLQNQASFSTRFDFQFTRQGGITNGDGSGAGADGLVFTVQTVSNTAGGSGGGIGYLGLPRSVGIEFDNWNNGGGYGDPDSNHVAIDFGGNFSPVGPLVRSLSDLGLNLDSGAILTSWIDYDGASDLLEVRVAAAGTARPTDAFISTTVDLEGILQSSLAYAGFTSGTGSAYANHDVRSWTFVNDFRPIDSPVPEPASLALGGLALGIAARSRRRAARA